MATPSLIRLALDDPRIGAAAHVRIGRRRTLRWLERLLIVVGVLCVSYYTYTYAEARFYQAFEDRELDKILNSASSAAPAAATEVAPVQASQRTVPTGTTVGRIEIPRLGVSAVIRAGSDARTLRLAVGYIPGTSLPGDAGNVGLAGHRDTFFRKLRDINPDDEIRVTTKEGVFHYYVQRTTIVMPQDVWVLDRTSYPALTLVTCYPFNYIGSAPKRFIVRAALGTSESPAAAVASKASDSIPTLQRKPTLVRVAAKRKASVHTNVSKPVHGKARLHTKRSTAPARLSRVKAPKIVKRGRTASRVRTIN